MSPSPPRNGASPDPPTLPSLKHSIRRWALPAAALAFLAASLSGLFYLPPGHLSGPWMALAALAAYGPVLFFAWTLSRGKPAPALRRGTAPFLLACLCHLAVQASGATESPLFPSYLILVLAVFRVSSWRRSLAVALLAALLEAVRFGSPAGGAVPAVFWPALASLAAAWTAGWLLKLAPAARDSPEAPGTFLKAGPAAGPAAARPGADLDPDQWLDGSEKNLMEMAFQAHPGWNSLVFLLVRDDAFVCRALLSRSPQTRADFIQPPGEGLLGWVLKEKKVLQVSRMAASSAAVLPYYLSPQPVQALACVPMFLEGEMRGALAADKLSEDAVHDHEMASLEALARQMAGAHQQADFTHRLLRRGEQFSRLHEASRQLGRDLDREALLRDLPDLLAGLVPFDSFYLAFREEEKEGFALLASRGYDEARMRGFRLEESGEGLLPWVLKEGEAVQFNAAQAGAQVPPALEHGVQGGARAFLLVPLLNARRVVGLLKLDRRSAAFTEQDREVAAILASQLAATLENTRLYEKHRRLATTDGLTGLFNHRTFQERLAVELEKAGGTGSPLSLVLMDIDFFKKFNDTFGHQEGDQVLKRVAALLQGGVRAGKDFACRYGGEEFVVVLPETGLLEAQERAEALRKACADTLVGGSGPQARAITLSMGICTFPLGARDQGGMIQRADEALYKAKQDGRNRVCTFKELP